MMYESEKGESSKWGSYLGAFWIELLRGIKGIGLHANSKRLRKLVKLVGGIGL